ncbi:carbamoyltransferase family protein [Sphaerimonospora thailandensis]|uniref:carbamoyltransferase family protein n=1 Tax=Sphaerimonospora thailandensis TaxID=795644 RepID=UPI001EF2DBA1|nr:carbamoyltransferase C-terminal domain-containing protein [Sphaerimonospora thailandensis]
MLGLGGPYYHDASACLVIDGRIIAFAEEERFSRRKHHKDSRSCAMAAAYCLAEAGITLAEVDEIAIAFNPAWPEPSQTCTDAELIAELLDSAQFGHHRPRQVTVIEHHLAHAASAFHPSGFDQAAVLVVDGSGDGVSATLAHGTASGLKVLRQWPFSQSLGWFYETVAEHLGLGDWTSSGKLMGLAGYGNPNRYELDFLTPQPGGYHLDLSRWGIRPDEQDDDQYTDLRYYQRLKRAYAAAYTDLGIPPHRRVRTYAPVTGRSLPEPGFRPEHADLAAAAQHLLEQCLIELAREALTATGATRLCVVGGVGLNCSANGRLAALRGVEDMFVQPAAGDAGCAIGAALEVALRRGDLTLPGPAMTTAALGPSFDATAIRQVLTDYGLAFRDHGDDLPAVIAGHLASGRTVGWFQGRMEAGPRALGGRSILADAHHTRVRDHINNNVKHREPWRPLAPVLLEEAAPELLGTSTPHPFMIVARQATQAARKLIPAVVHADGTLRPQTVARDDADPHARLLASFAEQTGRPPALLNTSFNHEAEPIVCTPRDAVATFAASPLDMLAIGPFLLHKGRPI